MINFGRLLSGLVSFLLPTIPLLASSWSPPVSLTTIVSVGDYATVPQVGVDGSTGNAIAVWEFLDTVSGAQNIQFSSYAYNDRSWSSPEFLTTIDTAGDTTLEVQIRLDETTGNAVAVWTFYDSIGNTQNIQASSYTSSTHSWGDLVSLTTIMTAGVYASGAQLGIDNTTGNAVAVWILYDNNARTQDIYSSSYTYSSNSWSSPVSLTSGNTVDEFSTMPQLGVDNGGNAVAVWTTYDSIANTSNIESSSYTSSTNSWSSPVALTGVTFAGNGAFMPQIGVDKTTGNAVATWIFSDTLASTCNIQSSSYDYTTNSWSVPVSLTSVMTAGIYASAQKVSVDSTTGNAVAIWTVYESNTSIQNIQSSSYTSSASTWSSPVSLTTIVTGGEYADVPQVSIDNTTGNAVAVWTFYEGGTGTQNIQSSSYTYSTNLWSIPLSLATVVNNGDSASSPQVGINIGTEAVAVWSFYDSVEFTQNIQSSSLY